VKHTFALAYFRRVTQNGCVLLGVDSPDSLRMARALATMLPGADAYYAQQRPEQQHLTLGRFGGSDAAGFAAWLSESLAGQNSLLPTFTGSHVQLSDEVRPFPNHPVPLAGVAGGAGAFGGLGNGGLGGGFGTVGGGFDAPIGGGGRGPIGASPIGAIGASPVGGGAGGIAPIGAGGAVGAPAAPAPAAAPALASGPSAAAPAQAAQAPTYASAMRVQAAAAAKAGSYAAAGASGKPAASAASPSPAAAAAAQSPEALLAMLQSSTAGAEGVGVIATSASVASGYVLRPQEQAAWSQRLAPLVTNLQGVLSAVGPLKFCQMIDGVANPNDWSLASEVAPNLSRGARLEVVQDNEISAAIEANAVAAANTGAQVRLVAAAVDQNVVGAPGHNDTGSPVMLCRSEHIVDGATGLTRVASFALHLEPVSQLQAAEKPYLSLTFAWLGARAAPVAAGDAGGGAAAGPGAGPALGGGGGVRRPGDWTCPGCAAHNFASRSVCFKCKNAKPGGGFGGGAGGDVGAKVSEPAGGPAGGNFRPGDWICSGCRAHNFASRSACFKCKQRKAGGGEGGSAPAASGGGSAAPENFRSGDWMCQNCRAHNFASRAACFKCSSKPSN
jgi:hypothetical protein